MDGELSSASSSGHAAAESGEFNREEQRRIEQLSSICILIVYLLSCLLLPELELALDQVFMPTFDFLLASDNTALAELTHSPIAHQIVMRALPMLVAKQRVLGAKHEADRGG